MSDDTDAIPTILSAAEFELGFYPTVHQETLSRKVTAMSRDLLWLTFYVGMTLRIRFPTGLPYLVRELRAASVEQTQCLASIDVLCSIHRFVYGLCHNSLSQSSFVLRT